MVIWDGLMRRTKYRNFWAKYRMAHTRHTTTNEFYIVDEETHLLQEGILRSFRVYVVNRACPGRMVM